ncbi:hypothetical protein Enr13x_60750 [Stieleria neptunia]|uniref:Uncharacterized protein n=1 Tax=Stieleria neptunia TaxID=2527979 RepID=A0A518HZ95_9BACT|nr:hypothetical protein [Stieleria neptunia]QDV46166.1 hypothetical protein Enr13x_60750 [Stieleria neptunia]
MQKRTKLKQQLLIAGCAGMMVTFTGCRSAMPKWNMFSWRSAPSAEALAGNGPTITYPTPPGESATPEAIASAAGGTGGPATRNVVAASAQTPNSPGTGFDAAVAANRTASATSRAAAQANGFNIATAPSTGGVSAAKLPGYPNPDAAAPGNHSSVPAIPAGYQFGTNSKSAARPEAAASSRYSMPSSYPAPGVPESGSGSASGYTLPGSSSPGGNSASSSDSSGIGFPSAGTTKPTTSAGGFALPDSMLNTVKAAASAANTTSPTNPQPFTPKPAATSGPATDSIAGPAGNSGFSLPGGSPPSSGASNGASAPSFSTASASLAPSANESFRTNSSSGYAPGSTSGSGSYPTTSGYPSTGTDGSFYR